MSGSEQFGQKKKGHHADTEQHTLVKEAGFDDVMWRCIDLHALFADSPRIFQSTLPQSRHVFCRQAPIERGDFVQRTIKFRRVALCFSCYAPRARTTNYRGTDRVPKMAPSRTVSPNGLISCVSLYNWVFVVCTT